jgi:heat shock protein HtpX
MGSWIKRIGLFLVVNFAVMITLNLILTVLGVGPYLTQSGLDMGALMAFCLVWGMGGAFFSLATSRLMAKWFMGVQVISPDTHDSSLQWLVQTVHQLSRSAGLPAMPEVGIYESGDLNAFATGPTRSRSLVAVSTGLLERMTREEVEGVLGHEVAHIANGDMVTMTLIQGIVNAFVMALARILGFAIAQAIGGRRDSEGRSEGISTLAFHISVFVLELVFMILGTLIVAWFSRQREFRADAGGAKLAGRSAMTRALQRLQSEFGGLEGESQPALATLKISSRPTGFLRFFSTHPPLEERIARLQQAL